MEVLCDEVSTSALMHKNSNVKTLVELRADLSHLNERDLRNSVVTLADGEKWYCIKAAVEATYFGASTKYVLLYRGKRYDTVSAEYV